MAKGIVRKIDELGRIVLPMEIRRELKIEPRTKIDMWLDGKIMRVFPYDTVRLNGIVRRLDELGRITLPKEYRKDLGLSDRSEVDMYFDGNTICIQAVEITCAICGRSGKLFDLHEVKEKHICKICALAVTDMVMEKGL